MFSLPASVDHGSFKTVAAQNRQSLRMGLMLRWLTGQQRNRAASLLVALYALCLVIPTAVMALDVSPAAAHCLTDNSHGQSNHHASHGTGESHHGSDGSSHHSDGGDHEKSQTGKCCGLFCVSSMVTDIDFVACQHPPALHVASLFVESLSGQDSDRIDRPPRFLPSL